MGADARAVVGRACRLLQAMVDVISSSGWLNPALAAMEMSQMVTQGLWQRDPVLMQLPHFTRELAAACADKGAPRRGRQAGRALPRPKLAVDGGGRALRRWWCCCCPALLPTCACIPACANAPRRARPPRRQAWRRCLTCWRWRTTRGASCCRWAAWRLRGRAGGGAGRGGGARRAAEELRAPACRRGRR